MKFDGTVDVLHLAGAAYRAQEAARSDAPA